MTRDNNHNNNALNGVVIGLLSSFGSAILLAFVFLAIYFFRYTSSGRIFLDRIGRPGEYDDEQAFAKEEAEALETMDDMARTEYLRAKGMRRRCYSYPSVAILLMSLPGSIYIREPSRITTNRHLTIAIPRYPGKGRIGVGVRARVGNSQLFCRGQDGDRVLRLRMFRPEQPPCSKTERGVLLGSEGLRKARQHNT